MKAIYLGTMLAAVLLSFQQKKTNNYWDDASVNGTRIYSICFIDNFAREIYARTGNY